jgi:hypothetical protein
MDFDLIHGIMKEPCEVFESAFEYRGEVNRNA